MPTEGQIPNDSKEWVSNGIEEANAWRQAKSMRYKRDPVFHLRFIYASMAKRFSTMTIVLPYLKVKIVLLIVTHDTGTVVSGK